MGDVGGTGGSSPPSMCDGDDVPPFPAPPRPCGLAPASPSPLGGRPSYNIMLYKAIQLPFKEHIVVGEFTDCEEISELLTIPQTEKVHRLRANEGNYEAAHYLLDCLKRKHGWFDYVLKALAIPSLKQQELIRVFLQAKEKVDTRWRARCRSDVDGGYWSPTTPTRTTTTPIRTTTTLIQETSSLQEGKPEAARSLTSIQQASQTRRKTAERSMSEPAPDDKYAYAKVEDPGLLSNSSWFHGDISREAAAQRLEGKDPGSFLVRRSHDHYTLSLRNEKGTVHVVIDERADPSGRLFYGLGEYNTIRYSTIPGLINYYSCHPVRVTGDGHTGTRLSKPEGATHHHVPANAARIEEPLVHPNGLVGLPSEPPPSASTNGQMVPLQNNGQRALYTNCSFIIHANTNVDRMRDMNTGNTSTTRYSVAGETEAEMIEYEPHLCDIPVVEMPDGASMQQLQESRQDTSRTEGTELRYPQHH